ncbi:metal ABC transporter ATP-binding protein [Saccharopolyspora indica]|uniref:zinc ABC transporter ATP-binding protein AztA n=1 Tax=Saccharopolyspora indica TaxID=1229659 RepID=UPI0022EB955C|nr:zinc ABC transporter ATP-binding protein AztA [Saccharopolyspora indica]MDA3642472.1 zinc ABC transporter ATP-binding protein AztA [Saccharopolyspora indica]
MTIASDRTEITIRGLTVGYTREPVLRGLSAKLPRGRTTAIIGPNGSGKSTLLSAIAGVLRPAAGTVEGMTGQRPAFVAQRSAVSDSLPISVRDTVTMGRWAHRGPWRRLTAHDRAVVEECLARLELRPLAARRLGSLSGGQRQRALLAQGLAQESGLLLLDEPATGLDAEARRLIADALEHAKTRGTTVVQVTHDFTEAERADHCLVLSTGRLITEGAPDDVLTPQVLQDVWGIRPRP